MKFQSAHINRDECYSLGIDEETGAYVLEVVIPWVAWYSRYFRVSKEEFEDYPASREKMDQLARSCTGVNGIENNRERFIFSQKSEEN